MSKETITSAVIKMFSEIRAEESNISDEELERLLKDIDIDSALNKIHRATSSMNIKVISKDNENIEKALEINKHFADIKINRIINYLLSARIYGYSVFEIVYNDDFTINSLVPIPHKYIDYKNNKWILKVKDNEIELNRDKFLLCIHKWSVERPKGKTIFESCKQSFLDKERYQKQLRGLSEKYGDVITVFPYDANLTEKEAIEQAKLLKEIQGKNIVGVPLRKGEKLKENIEFIKLSDLDPEIYDRLYLREKEKLLQNILGSTLTVQSESINGKGTQALGKVHEKGFEQVVQECCSFCIDSLYQLINSDSKFFGYDPKFFTWNFEKNISKEEKIEDEKYTALKIENISKLATAGYELDVEYLGNYLGMDPTKIIKKKNSDVGFEFSESDKKLSETIKASDLYKEQVEKKVDKFSGSISNQIQEQITKIKEGEDFEVNLNYSILEDDFIISQLKGYADNRAIAFGEGIKDIDPFKLKFNEAINSFVDKTPVMYEAVEQIIEEVQNKFFWVKKATDLEVTNRLYSNLRKSIEKGTTFNQWKKESLDVLKKTGLDKQGHYLQNVYRTNMMTQYSVGNYKQQMEVAKYFPYWEYRAIGDDRTTPICRDLDGVVKRYDDTFWNKYYPPNHYQCRSTVICRNEKELDDKGLKVDTKEYNHSHKGFDNNPAKKYWDNMEKNAGKKEVKLKTQKKELKKLENKGIIKKKEIAFKEADEELIRRYEDKTFKLFGYEPGDGILTEKEVESLKLYTGDEFEKINKYLRGEIKDSLAYAEYDQIYYNLSETSERIKNILKNNYLDDDLILYRGVNKQEFTALKKAKEFKSLKSTTLDKKVMKDFCEEAKEKYSLEKEYKVIINAPKGTQGIYINSKSAYEDEREFILNLGQKYKIIKEEEATLYLEVLK